MAETTPSEKQALRAALVRGAEKTFDNAEQLFREARLLTQAGAIARALCLHQLSLEECAKVDTLGAWAVSELLGYAVDQKRVLAALRQHGAKNRTNAYLLELSDAELDARARGDLAGALAAFKQTQAAFHANANLAKNAALYVDWVDGAFVAPAERITSEMLAEIVERNAEFLGFASTNLKSLQRLEAEPDAIEALLSGFVEQVETLRAERPDDVIAGIEALLANFLEAGAARLKDRPSG